MVGARPDCRGRESRRRRRRWPLCRRGLGTPHEVRPERLHRGKEGKPADGVPAPIPGRDADRPARRRHRLPVPARPDPDRHRPDPSDPAQRRHGPQPGGQGRGQRVGPPEDDGRQGEGHPRRRARRGADGGAGPGRRRQHRGRRPGSRGRPHRPCGDPGDRRIRPHRREPSRAQAGRCGCGRRRARGSHRHGVHEHAGDPRRRHAHRDDDGHGHGSRPHLGDAPGDHDRGDAADQAARGPDEPDPRDRRRRPAGLHRHRVRPRPAVPDALPDRRRVRRVRHPDGPAGGRHGRPVGWNHDPCEGRRDREAPPVGGDAGLNVRHQLRQDRDADPEPDDRRPDVDRRPALRDLRGRLFHGGHDHARGRRGRRVPRRVHAADGPLRRRRCRERHADRRPDGRRTHRPRGKGRGRPGADARAVPARRRPAIRRGLQADGDVPPHDRREGSRGGPGVREGGARSAPGAGIRGARPRRGRRPGRRVQGPVPRREHAPRGTGPPRHGHGEP